MVGFTVYQFLPPQDTPGLRKELQVFKVQFNLQCLDVGLVQTRLLKYSCARSVFMLA